VGRFRGTRARLREGFRGGARGEGGETEVDARVTVCVRWENDAE
jgi:hypothetical protein